MRSFGWWINLALRMPMTIQHWTTARRLPPRPGKQPIHRRHNQPRCCGLPTEPISRDRGHVEAG